MKKFVAFLIAGILCVSLVGCGNGSNSDASQNSTVNSTTESVPSESADTSSSSSTPSSSSEEMQRVEPKEYTTITSGTYTSDDKDMPVGSKIMAYPLDIEELFADRNYLYDCDELYAWEWVSFTGYVHFYKEGKSFHLSWSDSDDVEEFVQVIHVADKNISAENGWNVKDGDKITIVTRSNGVYSPWGDDIYMVTDDPFIVE